ncbi:MAG: hypothetical protein QXT40_03745 [Candidatus Micrarchaeia archaeon]
MQNQDYIQSNKLNIRNESSKVGIKNNFLRFRLLVEEGYKNTVDYIKNNPGKSLKIGSTAIVFSFMFGYVLGTKNVTENMVRSVNSTLSSIDRQNLKIISKLEEISTMQSSLDERVKSLEQQSKARLDTIENKIQFQKASEEDQKRVEEIKKKNKWKKLLPWNWF